MKKKVFSLMMTLVLAFAGVARADELTVKDGTSTNDYLPVYGLYADTQGCNSEFIIPAADLAAMNGGSISGMTFYLSRSATAAWTATFQVYLAEVQGTTLSALNGPNAGTVVYTGTLDGTGSTMTVTFSTPYTYNGGNLLVGTYVSVAGNYKGASFYGVSADPGSAYYKYGNYSYQQGQLSFLPKTTFTYTAGGGGNDPQPGGGGSLVQGPGLHVLYDNGEAEQRALVVDELVIGPRAAGAWMEPFTFKMYNDDTQDLSVRVLDFTPNDGMLALAESIELPFTVAANNADTLDLSIETLIPEGTAEGDYVYEFVAIYEGSRLARIWPLTLQVYTPLMPDVVEKAYPVNNGAAIQPGFEATLNALNDMSENPQMPLHDDYRLPYTDEPYNIPDGNDAVMKLVFDKTVMLDARVERGTNGKVALYTEDFYGESGPMAHNYYTGRPMSNGGGGGGSGQGGELTVHDGTDQSYYSPLYGFYFDTYTRSECVYPAAELTAMRGQNINSMKFYVATPGSLLNGWSSNIRVYLKEVADATISTFSGETGATVVYEGVLTAPTTVGEEFVINFTTPYRYNGGNLLLGTCNTATGSWQAAQWLGETVNGASIAGYSNNNLNNVTATQRNFLPKTTFAYGNRTQLFARANREKAREAKMASRHGGGTSHPGAQIAPNATPSGTGSWNGLQTALRGDMGYAGQVYGDEAIPVMEDGVYTFDVDDFHGSATLFGDANCSGLAYNPNTGTLYVADYYGAFMEVDPLTGTVLNETEAYYGIRGLAFDESTGLLYFIDGEGWLNYIDPTLIDYSESYIEDNDDFGFVDELSEVSDGGWVYGPAVDNNGNLYGIALDATNARLIGIDPTDAACTTLATLDAPAFYLQGFTFNPNDNKFYWAQYHDATSGNLYTIDPSSYAMNLLASNIGEVAALSIPYVYNATAGVGPEIDSLCVVAGTYYLVASDTEDNMDVYINVREVPCPEPAVAIYPADNADAIEPANVTLKWQLSPYATEYRLVFGSTYWPDDEPNHPATYIGEWTSNLAEEFTITNEVTLYANTNYFWRIDQRVNGETGCVTNGEVWGFTTTFNIPDNLVATPDAIYEGETTTLTWNNIVDRTYRSYKIYKDGQLIHTTPATPNPETHLSYTVPATELAYNPAGYVFNVTALYDEGESNFSNDAIVKVSGYSADPNGIYGYVYEQDSITPIAGVTVSVSGTDEFGNNQTFTATTDENGYYEMVVLVGDYTYAVANKPGYQSAEPYLNGPNFHVSHLASHGPMNFIMDEYFTQLANVCAETVEVDGEELVKVWWDFNFFSTLVEDFETGDLSKFDWQNDASRPWVITNDAHDGSYALKSGNAGQPSSTSTIQVTVNIPQDGVFSFYYKVNSEMGSTMWDYGRFYIDGVQKNQVGGIVNNWTRVEYPITAGQHTFKWDFYKDSSDFFETGTDCFTIDDITFVGMPDRSSEMADGNRSLNHYRIYRTDCYNYGPYTADNTTLLATAWVPDTAYFDVSWPNVAPGVYKWGVGVVYEGNYSEDNPVDPLRGARETYDFEGNLQGWTTIDADGDGRNFFYSMNHPVYDQTGKGHNGSNGFAISASYQDNAGVAFNANNYLVSPQMVSIENGSTLDFWFDYGNDNYPDFFEVCVSTEANPTAAGFTSVWTVNDRGTAANKTAMRHDANRAGNWRNVSVDLSAYAGQNVWVAFHHQDYDEYEVYIDDVTLGASGTPTPGPTPGSNCAINELALPRESCTVWSDACSPCIDKDMDIPSLDGEQFVSVNVVLNDAYPATGTSVKFTNLNEYEQALHPQEVLILGETGYHEYETFRRGNYAIEIYHEGFYTIFDTVGIGVEPDMAYELRYVMEEILYPVRDFYVSYTGFAMWDRESGWEGGSGVTPPTPPTPGENVTVVLSYPVDIWEDGTGYQMLLDADATAFGTDFEANGGYGPTDYSNFEYTVPENAAYPANTGNIVGAGSSATITIPAGTYDWVIVNPTNGGGTQYITAGNGNVGGRQDDYVFEGGKTYTFTLSLYGYNDGCDVVITDGRGNVVPSNNNVTVFNVTDSRRIENSGNANGDVAKVYNGNRDLRVFEYYKVMCTSIDGQPIFNVDVTTPYCQLATDQLVEGETYICKVASVFSTGMSEWRETEWVYRSCANYAGSTTDVTVDGNEISWTYPGGDGPTPPVPPTPGEDATIVLNVPTNIWGDGTGYQMLLDADATKYTELNAAQWFDAIGSFDGFEYFIPENADYSTCPQNTVIMNSVSITVPAGTYDYGIINPDCAGTIWFAGSGGNVSSKGDDQVFEAGKTYTYTVSDSGTGDAVNLVVTDTRGVVTTFVGNNGVNNSPARTGAVAFNGTWIGNVTSGVVSVEAARDGWLNYDNGNYSGVALGLSNQGTGEIFPFQFGVMFPAGSYEGTSLTKVAWYDAAANSGTIEIYQGGATAPGNMIYSQPYNTTGSETMDEVALNQPVAIDATQNLWFVLNTNGGFVAALDNQAGNANGMWLYSDLLSDAWQTVVAATGGGYNGNWLMRAYVETGSTPTPTPAENIIGAAIYQNGQPVDFVDYPTNTWTMPASGEYCVRIIYDGPMDGSYYSMSCEQCVGGDVTCTADFTINGEYYWNHSNDLGAHIWWGNGDTPPVPPTPGETTFTEGFETGLNGWNTIKVNAAGGEWLHSSANPGGHDYNGLAHDGSAGFAMCYSFVDYDGPYDTDAILYTPQRYQIVNGSTLKFYADNANDDYPESFSVVVATAENPTAADFVQVWGGNAKANNGQKASVRHDANRYNNWREHTVDLSAYAGQSVWIGFRDTNYDAYEIWIDDVVLSDGRGARAEVESYNVYRSTDNVDYELVINIEAQEGVDFYEYFDGMVEAGTTYYYQVTAVYSDGCESQPALAEGTEDNYVMIGVTAIDENAGEVALYPNPTSGNVKIEARGMNHITVVSALGQVVYDADVNADEMELNMAQWNAGVYVVRIVTESGISTQRVTVVR